MHAVYLFAGRRMRSMALIAVGGALLPLLAAMSCPADDLAAEIRDASGDVPPLGILVPTGWQSHPRGHHGRLGGDAADHPAVRVKKGKLSQNHSPR